MGISRCAGGGHVEVIGFSRPPTGNKTASPIECSDICPKYIFFIKKIHFADSNVGVVCHFNGIQCANLCSYLSARDCVCVLATALFHGPFVHHGQN